MLNYARIDQKDYVLCINIDKIFKIIEYNNKTTAYKNSANIKNPILIFNISKSSKKRDTNKKIILTNNKKFGFFVNNIIDISQFHFNPCQINLIKKYNLNPDYITKTAMIDEKIHFLIDIDLLTNTLQKEGKL